MRTVQVNYEEVYARAQQMRGTISAELGNMEAEYRQVLSRLENNTDGAAAAALLATVSENRRKAQEVASTMNKLLSFMVNSTRQVEAEELKIANVFNSSVPR